MYPYFSIFFRTSLNKILPVKLFRLKDYSIISYVVLDNSEPDLNSDVVPSVLHEVLSSTTFPHYSFYKHQMWYGEGHRRRDK